jgi:hypothetical protein
VLVASLPRHRRSLKRGDVVVFRHAHHGMMIKKIDHVMPRTGDLFVTGTHEASVDSRQFGPVKQEQLSGKVIWHFKRSGSNRPYKSRRE